MSEGLIVRPEQFAALSPASQMLAAREANGEDFGIGTLIRVKTPSGGATSWEIDDGLGNTESVKEIVGALVLYRKQAVLWGSPGDPIEGVKPYLRSNDHPNLQWGTLVDGGDPGSLDVDLIECCIDPSRSPLEGNVDIRSKRRGGQFYYAEFGSAPKGSGCWLKEQRLLGVLRPGDQFPLLITVQPGSLKKIKDVMSRLPWPHYQAIVKLTLTKQVSEGGQPYSQLAMSVVTTKDENGATVSPISHEQALVLKSTYTDPLNAAIEQGVLDQDQDESDEA